ncbi:auxin-responsive protein SAUR21-like [Amaranthus tricolor]|uniref:auxin-responsive protein SAUR21-like n=1 Tax=Amaranthus tricolor TaxID=29722 RepID=UPI002587CECF|nr:auxin-responsive protein SAUR21-like [Amaranthus tricolor]
MAIRFTSVLTNAKQMITKNQLVVPKGYVPVYVGEQTDKKRYVVPLSFLSRPAFQELLQRAEDEFGFNHPMGALTIPCTEQTFFTLTSQLRC